MKFGIYSEVVFRVGPVEVTEVVVTTWFVMLALAVSGLLLARGLSVWEPGRRQIVIEGVYQAIAGTIRGVLQRDPGEFVPLVGGMWIFIASLNLVGLIPGLHNPTRDLSTASSLAFVSFMSVHYYGIKHRGLRAHLRRYAEPVLILLPFNVFGEVSRSLAMAVRLFGNMLSWEMIVAILLLLVGFVVPVPLILLSIVGDVIQAYLFGALTLVFIAGSIKATEI
ncbi:MAG TPA: F0F1 ATP synthase subunit A [Nitrospirae bacterium]|nr:F0F1 ATP synthase subunit A [Nitrospirota bacterium]